MRPFLASLASLALAAAAALGVSPAAAQSYSPARLKVSEPPREFRGAWVACVHNLDWPSRPGLSAAAQKAELVAILDEARALRLNAVVLQVRPMGDALYETDSAPWSSYLTGTMGKSPGYDPLAFAVAEAHRRGLELHAWFNPFRASASDSVKASAGHVTRRFPDLIRRYGSQKWVDPGDPRAAQMAVAAMAEVARRYEVDGIHIDDYFYPYPIKGKSGANVPFDDDATYARFGNGKDRAEWRRANVDAFVRGAYAAVKAARPSAKFGISPFGIWRPGHPRGIEAELDAYEHISADSRRWLREGWLDYFSPQLYWPIRQPEQSFTSLLDWWAGENKKRRHLWPGIASARIGTEDRNGIRRPAGEILDEIAACRRLGASGHVHWNASALQDNKGGIAKLLPRAYPEPALVPASPWLGNDRLGAPAAITAAAAENGGVALRWAAVPGARFIAIQEQRGGTWRLRAIVDGGATAATLPGSAADAIAVRAVDQFGNLGDAAAAAR